MVLLATPHVRFHRSFLEATDEFEAADESLYNGILAWPAQGGFPGVEFTRDGLEDPAEFERFVGWRVRDALPESPRPPDWVPCTYRWMEEPERPGDYVGSVSLRHTIDHPLLQRGGHIGYMVRPSHRRRGHATDALRQTVRAAAELGIDRVLVTCDLDNTASARVIEAGGGQFADEYLGKRRYWIPTAVSAAAT